MSESKETPQRAQRVLICPTCEDGELRPFGRVSMRCFTCDQVIGGPMLETLRNIYVLPDAIGKHACECGHPEMKRLPDKVYWCPACGSEVLPTDSSPTVWKTKDHTEAYWCGWLDGRYAEKQADFTGNSRLVRWEHARDRLEYYRGHREGRKERISTKKPGKASEEAA
ncbi:MAG: hypothetical protein ACR2N0_07210 [Rubrobacteraceae bacterium]